MAKNTKSRIDIQEELNSANNTIKNSEFIGEAVNCVVDNQEAIVITVFRMLTTFVVGLITRFAIGSTLMVLDYLS